MFQNSHFALATHMLVVLAFHRGAAVTSGTLAQSINTNAAFVRTLIGQLKAAGLVEVSLGKGGGARLSRPAAQISLRDVKRAVEGEGAMKLHRCEPNERCIVGRNILSVLEEVQSDIDGAVEERLKRRTIADLTQAITTAG